MNWAALRVQHDIRPEPRGQENRFVVKINGGNYGRPIRRPMPRQPQRNL